MDEIIIESFKLGVRIGINEWEKRIEQSLLLDLHLYKDFSNITDDISQTIDYDVLCQHIENFVHERPFQLIETVANRVAEEILSNFPMEKVKVVISKPHALRQAKTVKVIAIRAKEQK